MFQPPQPRFFHPSFAQAINELGASKPSQSVTFTTPPSSPQPIICLHVVEKTANSVTLSWKAPRDNGSSIVCYRVEVVGVKMVEVGVEEVVVEGGGVGRCLTTVENLAAESNYRCCVCVCVCLCVCVFH